MIKLKSLALASVVAILFATTASRSHAQVSVEVGIAPECPYGYYDYAPYSCAPYGYYGPEWFSGGVFVGAGPWFHGPKEFHGYVDNHYDPHHGYKGPMPKVHDKSERPERAPHDFKGNENRDGRGHTAEEHHPR